ncbi:MAG: ABC transporter permease [Deltaproteobacteria bacterium]|nr:ABC transporter permease [Deltaproteobacteria bacterium]MBW2086204.1 ABC transporter permease [Deltaproteobacteria bacterium]
MESSAVSVVSGQAVMPKTRGFIANFFVRLFKEKPLGAVGGVIFAILLFTGIFANFLAPKGYNEMDPINRLKTPSREYILGTDHMGRDMLSRIIYGARLSLIIGSTATFFSILISTFIGITTGYIGGKYDLIVQRLVDAWMIFPGLVVLIVFVSIFSPGMWQIIFILGLQYGIAGSRIIRGATISTKENMYVKAADSIGASTLRLLLKHILPNIMAPIIILFTTRIAAVILAEATLSFLGLGIPPPAPSWGAMLSGTGRSYMLQAPWLAFVPGLALTIVVYGINVFGDALRDLLDPRLRGGGGRYSGKKVKKKRVTKEKEA